MGYAGTMAIDTILSQIDAEIARLQQVRKLLAGAGSISSSAAVKATRTKAAKSAPRKRVLSPEARKRIADAQRRRWAAQRKANKKDA